jgi:hypothetical protein
MTKAMVRSTCAFSCSALFYKTFLPVLSRSLHPAPQSTGRLVVLRLSFFLKFDIDLGVTRVEAPSRLVFFLEIRY